MQQKMNTRSTNTTNTCEQRWAVQKVREWVVLEATVLAPLLEAQGRVGTAGHGCKSLDHVWLLAQRHSKANCAVKRHVGDEHVDLLSACG